MLLQAAYGNSSGFAEVIVAHYEDKELVFDTQRWFDLPQQFEGLEAFVARHTDEDVYFTPGLYSDKRRVQENATVTNVVYMDADVCTPEKFRVTPTFSVETSPGKWQCYWLLDQEQSAHKVSDLAHRIAAAHKDDGCDPSSWIMTKLMRVPGTKHRKTKNHYPITLRENTGEVFSFEQLNGAYSDISLPQAVSITKQPMPIPEQLPKPAEIASHMPDELTQLFIDGPIDSSKRSEARFSFQIALFKHGFTPEWIFAACQQANGLDKFSSEGRPEQLWNEILKAEQYAGVEAAPELREDQKPVPISLEFITHDERVYLENNPTFIDEYVAWVKERSPLSAESYQRTLAYMLLSCVYGDKAYITPQFGHMKLNLWALICGETTATRKSTSRNLLLSVLNHWERVTGNKIDIGSDFTAQALVKTLGERDGKVSLIHRDEFQGFIHEIQTQNYMAGAAERLTELYDGRVRAVLRNTKELATEKEADTVFNLLALGITRKIADRMTADNFRSGFLPRFLWSTADAPNWKPEDEYVMQMSEEQDIPDSSSDPQVNHFIQQFRLGHKAWASQHPRAIRFSDEALARWNQWKVDTKKYIRGLENEEIMEPARDRMAYSVWKAAALLAIHGREKEITLDHLLPVLQQAEWWFRDMMKMASLVAASDFEHKVDKIELMLAAGNGQLLMSKIYGSADFKQFRKGEVDECISSLKAQGRAHEALVAGKLMLVSNNA